LFEHDFRWVVRKKVADGLDGISDDVTFFDEINAC